jgi:Kef-type K+ transport system membrane component KefB
MSTSEIFLIAMTIILTVPYLVWRIGRTDYYAPLVVVQIVTGILLGPGILGAVFPDYHAFLFNPQVVQALNGIAWWAVMVFVWIAGIELDLKKTWEHRRESAITAGLALGMPLLFGCGAATVIATYSGWLGPKAATWQFILGVGMACAVTALPVLILLMDRLDILRQPIGQRMLRYASLDDVAVWGVLALILLDWQRVGRQLGFLLGFAVAALVFRRIMAGLAEKDRWYVGLIWLALCSFAADWSGLHYMVGAFLSGAVIDSDWFDRQRMDTLRHNVLLVVMPVFFLSTGLRTEWTLGGPAVFVVAGILLAVSVSGKLAGMHLAGKFLKWQPGEGSLIGWLLQTKGLVMIVFANILLDKGLITSDSFTALLLMALASTMLTIPVVSPKLQRMKELIFISSRHDAADRASTPLSIDRSQGRVARSRNSRPGA